MSSYKLTDRKGAEIDIQRLLENAKSVLNGNWVDGHTKPNPHLYPHQWSWDSGFIAYGFAHFDQERAQQELLSLFKGQWGNGLVPQIVFHHDSPLYFPGPDFWQTDRHAQASDNPSSSGIIQPPIHASATLHIYKHATDKESATSFLETMYPKLVMWHDFLYRERDPGNEKLIVLFHPWESGQDNSPLWDEVLEKISPDPTEIPHYVRKDTDLIDPAERPKKEDYDRYVYLVKLMWELDYDQSKIAEECPFVVQDVLTNTLLVRANHDLAEIAEILGIDGSKHESRAEETAKAMNEKLWDGHHGVYYDYDLVGEKTLHVHHGAGFSPLFAEVPDQDQAKLMIEYLNSRAFCKLNENCYAVPSYDMQDTKFDPSRYWRGPVWLNVNWILYRGCRLYGFHKYAEWVRESIIHLPHLYGFCEYYDPHEGKGYGTENFSWSAALFIDTVLVEFVKS